MTVFARTLALAVPLAATSLLTSIAPADARMFDPTTFTLPNGLQVVVITNMRAPVVEQMVWYHAGAADEPAGKSGIAHYLEHLMFKGTKTMKPGEFSHIVAMQGGEDNAFTTHDYTAYHETVAVDRLELMMKLEADRMANLSLTDPIAKPELQVVREERRMRIDNNPASQLGELSSASLFLNHPYRLPPIGWDAEIQRLNYHDALTFYRTWYAPNNATLVIEGAVTLDQVKPLAIKYFGPIASHPVPRRERLVEPPHLAPTRVEMTSARVHEPTWGRDYLAPSYRTSTTPEQGYAIEVLAEVLGGSAVSRLDRAMVLGDSKLAASVSAGYDADAYDLGTFALAVTPRPGVSLADIEKAVDAQIERLLKDGVTEDEVANAREHLQESAIYSRDSLGSAASIIGAALSIGRTIDDVESWPDRISKVTAAEVNAAAHTVLKDVNSVTTTLKPEPQS
jgi:zinc protease